MQQLIDWKIYYGDGSVFTNLDGEPQDAPCGNVQRIAYYDADGRRKFCHDKDYYIYENNCWYAVDMIGFLQYMSDPGFKIVKFGRMMPDLKFRELCSYIDNDLPLVK